MRGAIGIILLVGAALPVVSCTSQSPEIKIRSAGSAPVSPSVADARAELALGNVALALEGFRKAVRERPQDVDALSGLALCYEQMGRPDLGQKWLETALAAAPDNPELLRQLADLLDRQGNHDEAVAVRSEAAIDGHVIASAMARVADQKSAQAFETRPSSSVTIVLPPAKPLPQSIGVVETAPKSSASASKGEGPHLERLSLGEVALVTTKQPIWRPVGAFKSLAMRFTPVQLHPRLLNAARAQGLAARTRERLLGHGWRDIEIGDAPMARERTLVLYPPAERARAQRLVAELGIGTVQPSFAAQLTVLLGRDLARSSIRRPM